MAQNIDELNRKLDLILQYLQLLNNRLQFLEELYRQGYPFIRPDYER